MPSLIETNRWKWSAVTKRVRARDRYTCQMCGTRTGPMEVDHIVPRIVGGTDDLGNLRLVCRLCHKRRMAGADAVSGVSEVIRSDYSYGGGRKRGIG